MASKYVHFKYLHFKFHWKMIVFLCAGDITCGQTLTGSLHDSPASTHLVFVNDRVQDVTFTDCDSDFDPVLYLMDSSGNSIQNQSTNGCDGDNCYEATYCNTSLRETFTMSALDEGTYTLLLTTYKWAGGGWAVSVYCSPTKGTLRFDCNPHTFLHVSDFVHTAFDQIM